MCALAMMGAGDVCSPGMRVARCACVAAGLLHMCDGCEQWHR